ncbi:hypothetical protein RB213_003895 [Colletotrichum asianum]
MCNQHSNYYTKCGHTESYIRECREKKNSQPCKLETKDPQKTDGYCSAPACQAKQTAPVPPRKETVQRL